MYPYVQGQQQIDTTSTTLELNDQRNLSKFLPVYSHYCSTVEFKFELKSCGLI